ncbi:AAA family ATPase [Actinomadura sp.]|uniref:MinD/ParA family ATP-binding protein n=1 Tax=Actinomadura sp. TaxID=1989 RepID=UPI0037C9DF04
MARNEHDGRSLEERLASLDAMSEDAAEPAPEGEEAPQQPPARQENAPPPPPPAAENNPWLAAPPAFQGGPEDTGFNPPQPPPPLYDGGPMPQPFDGGMLPPPYYPAPANDPSQGGQPPQPSPYDVNGSAAPPLDQLPPYPSDQLAQQQDASGQYQAIDPATGQPYPQDTDASGQPYVPIDPNTGRPLTPDEAGSPQEVNGAVQQQFPPADPNAGLPYAPDPNAQQFPPADPNAGAQPYPQQFPPIDPNTGQPYPQVDPNTGQPYPQPYPQIDPNTGQPYPQPYPQIDPNTGQPYMPIDPNTGQPYQAYGYPAGPHQGQPQQGQPQQGQMIPPGHAAPPQQPQSTDSLSSENLLGERRIAPSSGWRRAVYKATAGSIHPGESQSELRRKDLIARARTPVAGGHHRVAVMSLKGGVGKTTTTTGLGSMLGSFRGDRVIAVDANPDRGTLSDKVKLETAATVRDLLNNRENIHRYADVRAFTSQNEARLEILASDRDPAVSEAFSAEDYAAVAVVLEQYYSVCITDCGTGLLHSAMAGVLSLADQLVLVSSPSVDGARSASATLDWLEAHDHGHLVRNGVVVLSMVRNRTRSQVDLDKLQAHFESRCRAVVRIPYDDHLEEGAEVELDQLAPATREAYLTLAAVVGDGFAFQRPPQT